MPSISKIQKADKTIKVEVPFDDGEVLNLVAYPNRITGARRKEMAALEDMTDDDMPKGTTVAQRSAELLFDVIQKWDLTDDEGKVLPFDETTVDLLSVPTMAAIYVAIGEASNPNPKTSKKSHGR